MIVIVNKMEDFDQIEDLYKNRLELLDLAFLRSIKEAKDKDNLKKLEVKYHKDLNILLVNYEQRVDTFLKNQKKQFITSEANKKSRPKENTKSNPDIVLESKDNAYAESFLFKLDFFKFNFMIKYRRFIFKVTPNFIYVLFIKTKLSFMRIKCLTSNFFDRLKKDTISDFESFKNILLEFSNYIRVIIKEIVLRFKKIFAKKSPENKEKTEDQKIVDKILAKNN